MIPTDNTPSHLNNPKRLFDNNQYRIFEDGHFYASYDVYKHYLESIGAKNLKIIKPSHNTEINFSLDKVVHITNPAFLYDRKLK